ncbi:ATP--guanido phosphotransferase, partial [Leptospira gomenensis]
HKQDAERLSRFEFLSESEKWKELEKLKPPFSYRFRIGRNLAGRIYPTASGVPTTVLKSFLIDGIGVPTALLEGPNWPTRIPWGEGNLFTGDEDHLRWEIITDSLEELFSKIEAPPIKKFENPEFFDFDPNLHYVTSCPTNAGLGTKISLKLSMRIWKNRKNASFKIPGFLEFYLENSSEFVVFYLKNFAVSQKNSFLNLVYYLALQVKSGF